MDSGKDGYSSGDQNPRGFGLCAIAAIHGSVCTRPQHHDDAGRTRTTAVETGGAGGGEQQCCEPVRVYVLLVDPIGPVREDGSPSPYQVLGADGARRRQAVAAVQWEMTAAESELGFAALACLVGPVATAAPATMARAQAQHHPHGTGQMSGPVGATRQRG